MTSTSESNIIEKDWFVCEKRLSTDDVPLPVYYVKFNEGYHGTEHDMKELLEIFNSIYKKEESFRLFVNTKNANIPGSAYTCKHLIGEWMKENEQNAQIYLKGTAVVLYNMLVRNLLKFTFAYIQVPKTPVALVNNMSEGFDIVKLKKPTTKKKKKRIVRKK